MSLAPCAGASEPYVGYAWDDPRGQRQQSHVIGEVKTGTLQSAVTACKTVGSAYVGSNLAPAITCENGPLGAVTPPGGPFSYCPGRYQPAS
jgi:hypothetical protein